MSILSSIVRGLAPAATVAGNAIQGYGIDQQNAAKALLAKQAAERAATNDAITNRVKLAGIDPDLQAALAGAKVRGETPAIIERNRLQIPLDVQKAGEIATAQAPAQQATHAANAKVDQQTHEANRAFDVTHPLPVQSSFSFPVVTDENGRQVVAKANTKTGDIAPTDIGAKPSGSQAKLTADQEKSYLFYNLMKNAEPRITAALGSGQIRPAAVQAFLSAGSASEIPVVGKAIGALAKPLANANLNEEEQQMIRAGKDFAAGVLRKESGAAVTNSELYEVMERYFPGMFGDKPGLTNDKGAARREYMQTMEQEAGPAIRFYGQQHSTKPSGGAGHEQLSDEEFARQWQAGKRSWP